MSGLCVSVRDLPQRTGANTHTSVRVEVGPDWHTPVARVREGSCLDLDVDLTAIDQGVVARVRTHAPAVGECVRCLDEVDLSRDIDISQVFYLREERDKLIAAGDEDAVHEPLIVDDAIDLDECLRDAIVGQLPLRPLCGEDCEGLCSVCGEALRDLDDGHHHAVIDQRWASLADFFSDTKED